MRNIKKSLVAVSALCCLFTVNGFAQNAKANNFTSGSWQGVVVEKAKSVQKKASLKYFLTNPFDSIKDSSSFSSYQKERQQERIAKFKKYLKRGWGEKNIYQDALAQYDKLQALIVKNPLFAHYTLTLEHPADLIEIKGKDEWALISGVLESLEKGQPLPESIKLERVELYPSETIVATFTTPGWTLYIEFNNPDASIKVVVGDFPRAEDEYKGQPKIIAGK